VEVEVLSGATGEDDPNKDISIDEVDDDGSCGVDDLLFVLLGGEEDGSSCLLSSGSSCCTRRGRIKRGSNPCIEIDPTMLGEKGSDSGEVVADVDESVWLEALYFEGYIILS